MGNSASNANQSPHSNSSRLESPARRTASPARGGSPAPSSRVHRSLRQKKKSLELPDLASLALTPASSSPQSVSPHNGYRNPRASSPIPIPISAHPPVQTFRPQNNLPSAAQLHFSRNRRSYLSSAYPSTQSFVSGSPPEPVPEEPVARPAEYVPEVVHSTLPVLLKAEDEASKPEPVTVPIRWRGGGRSVVLARAGHDNWNGRQPMEYDSHTNSWTTSVRLLPGTHHFKFVVDDQWRTEDEYPTAVDDRDGSLANYVNVTAPASSSYPHTPAPLNNSQSINLWNDGEGSTSVTRSGSPELRDGEWTTEIPPELIQAAAEEESYLASADSPGSSASIPAPNIPPAPALPRHLDKLILNVRPAAVTGTGSSSSRGSGSGSEKERSSRKGSRSHHSKRDREGRSRTSNLASVTDITALSGPSTSIPEAEVVGAKKTALAKLDGPGVADDASVLPVPNHVVLHHLSTSAIRNGVLAVANTTRYRKKYITTIYYKPT